MGSLLVVAAYPWIRRKFYDREDDDCRRDMHPKEGTLVASTTSTFVVKIKRFVVRNNCGYNNIFRPMEIFPEKIDSEFL